MAARDDETADETAERTLRESVERLPGVLDALEGIAESFGRMASAWERIAKAAEVLAEPPPEEIVKAGVGAAYLLDALVACSVCGTPKNRHGPTDHLWTAPSYAPTCPATDKPCEINPPCIVNSTCARGGVGVVGQPKGRTVPRRARLPSDTIPKA